MPRLSHFKGEWLSIFRRADIVPKAKKIFIQLVCSTNTVRVYLLETHKPHFTIKMKCIKEREDIKYLRLKQMILTHQILHGWCIRRICSIIWQLKNDVVSLNVVGSPAKISMQLEGPQPSPTRENVKTYYHGRNLNHHYDIENKTGTTRV